MLFKSKMNQTLFLIGLLIVTSFLYNRYKNKMHRESLEDNDAMIQKYLLSVDDVMNHGIRNKKPILWIHIEYTYNARHWESFGSRSSYALNQPYLYLTLRSIIHHCNKSFHICLIDDKSFKKLLPDWQHIDMTRLADPIKYYKRQLAMAKILYKYGGLHVPASFLCMRNLHEMYENGTSFGRMFLVENVDRNVSSVHSDFAACLCVMGAHKENPTVEKLISYMETTLAHDYTEESRFLGKFSEWCEQHGVFVVDGKMVGTKTDKGGQVLVDHLLNQHTIAFYRHMYGILIPAREILNRTHYEWFARLSESQIYESKVILCKYITSVNLEYFKGVLEPMKPKQNWVSFWKVPSSAPVWGLRPDHLGNYVPRA